MHRFCSKILPAGVKHIAFFNAHFFGKAACGNVAAYNFNRNDFYFFAKLFAVAELFNKVVFNTVFAEQVKKKLVMVLFIMPLSTMVPFLAPFKAVASSL